MELKKGQKVWVWDNLFKDIKETTIKSIGRKYITVEGRCSRIKFDVNTLSEVNPFGIASFIIPDLEAYNREKYYNELKRKLKYFDWSQNIEEEDLDAIYKIVKEYL